MRGAAPFTDEDRIMFAPDSIELSVAGTSVVVEPSYGGRLSSLQCAGHELLWQPDTAQGIEFPGASHPFGWGSFVMAPYAGRIRRGEFTFEGTTYRLPIAMAPHAIHGTLYDVAWNVDEVGRSESSAFCQLSVSLTDPWPFAGRVTQRIEVSADMTGGAQESAGVVAQRLWLHADQAMPATMGWHPWFTRVLATADGADSTLEWSFDHEGVSLLQRDADGITTANAVPVPEGPWDDCFAGVADVTVRWPGLVEVVVSHDCPVVVLFDGLDHAVCVEPQTGPPNAPELWSDRVTLGAGKVQEAHSTWTWRLLSS